MKRLAGVRVLVTGAGSGIGRALALAFASAGAEVIATDVDSAAAGRVSADIRATGGRGTALTLDVTSAPSIASVRQAVASSGGPVAVLVNSAGTVHGGPLLAVPTAHHLATLQINLGGLIAVTRAFLPDLIAVREGHLINLASASAFVGLPYGSVYAATKWGVVGFSESIRLELRELGHRHVGVTTVCPSYVKTGLFDGAGAPRLTPLLTPDRVAALTLRAVRRRRAFVLAPWMVAVTPRLRGLLPLPVFDWLAGRFGVTRSMATWRGRAPGADPLGAEPSPDAAVSREQP